MTLNCIRWGILGTSKISETMAKALQFSTKSKLSAIGSRSLKTAKDFAEKFSIPTFHGDYQALLNDPAIDAVYIGLPNHAHKEWIIRAAQAGKHILCEKPFVVSVKEAKEVISVVEKENVLCMEALMYRYHPFIHKLQEMINEKIIGDIKLMTAAYTANIAKLANPICGGAIRNLGCYPVSLVRLLANAEPMEILSHGRMDQQNQNDNQASTLLKFENGILAVVSTADDMEMCWQFDVYGTTGNLKVISNPWMPNDKENKILLYRNNKENPVEINVTAEKPLYTYQFDTMSYHIMQEKLTEHDGISLQDSLGNVSVLETWLEQVKFVREIKVKR